MTEPTIKHRLAGLRERLSDLVWDAAFPGKETKITEEDLKDRRVLAEEGFISIFCTIDAQTGRIKVGPEIRARAFAEEDHVFDDVKPQIALALAQAAAEGIRDSYAMQQVIRRTIGTWVNKAHRRRPMIIPVVIVD